MLSYLHNLVVQPDPDHLADRIRGHHRQRKSRWNRLATQLRQTGSGGSA